LLSMRFKDLTHLKHYFTSSEARASQGTQVKVLEMQHYNALASTYCGFTFARSMPLRTGKVIYVRSSGDLASSPLYDALLAVLPLACASFRALHFVA